MVRVQRSALAAAAVACAVVLGGCGSGGASDGAAPAGGYGASVRFADCMRSHGVPGFPDPLPTGGFSGGAVHGRSSPAYQAAAKRCTPLLRADTPRPGPNASEVAAMLGYARCMRAHGVPSFPDPVLPSQAPHSVDVLIDGPVAFPVVPGVDPESPAFHRADAGCGGMPASGGPAPSGPPKGG